MPAQRIHLIRHGEVHNPGAVIYGRLPHFRLSDRGHQMAAAAAEELRVQKRPVGKIFASPLLRTRESAEHVEKAFGVEAKTDERLIEPWNKFEGRKLGAGHIALRPHLFYHLRNPQRPSWGEPFDEIASRMLESMDHAWNSVPDGDVVLVSHQLPIEMVHRKLSGKKLPHNPRKRRTALSSVTSFERNGSEWVEVDYKDPGAGLSAIDKGAV
jgi:broad specificity phosphatase PhoE